VRSRWKRIVLWTAVGVVVALLAAAGGFYLWFHGQVSASNSRIDPAIVEALKETTTPTTAPTPDTASGSTSSTLPDTPSGMNIVLLGYDTRAAGSKEITEGRSDTIILLHVDPSRGFLSVLSVPRDMLADVPGYGLYKINAAYAFGGGALLIRTIQSKLGVDLDHYIGLDLEAFKAITNALGGVYVDVDRQYLNETQSWEHIKLQAGYQLLNGADALDFVRFRHDDNIDFGRMARQQAFLVALREQALGWNLPFKLPGLVKALFQNVDTDLSATDLIKLGYWVMKLDGSRIKRAEIKAHTGMIHGVFYVLPTDEELSAAVGDFYSPPAQAAAQTATQTTTQGTASSATTAPAPTVTTVATSTQVVLTPGDLGGIHVGVVDATGRLGQGALAAVWLDRQGASVVDLEEADQPLVGNAMVTYPAGHGGVAQTVAQALGIVQVEENSAVDQVTVTLGTSYLLTGTEPAGSEASVPDLSKWRALAAATTLPLEAPTFLPADVKYSFDRSYDVAGGTTKPAVRVGYKFGSVDRYVGVSETTWLDAPLASPGLQARAGDGVVYTVVGTNGRVDHVWWNKDGVLHWVSNTLYSDLNREELLAIAMSMTTVVAAGG
jgi:LCP family protein required for cell wall assembly